MQHCVHRVLRNRNLVPGVGRVLGEEEVMFGKGNEMIPLVRDWRELCKGVLGVDSQGEEGKGSEVGAISAPPCYGHSFPQDIPRIASDTGLSTPALFLRVTTERKCDCHVGSLPVPKSTAASSPLPHSLTTPTPNSIAYRVS